MGVMGYIKVDDIITRSKLFTEREKTKYRKEVRRRMMAVEWNEEKGYFWMGANGSEFIAYKGSHQIFIYPIHEHPAPPSDLIQHNKKIDTAEDFRDALETGEMMKALYIKDKVG